MVAGMTSADSYTDTQTVCTIVTIIVIIAIIRTTTTCRLQNANNNTETQSIKRRHQLFTNIPLHELTR